MERGKEDNMWPYFLLIFIIFLLQFKYGNGGKSKIRFYVGLIILFLFAALRGVSNGDYDAYLTRGKEIDSLYKIIYNNTNMELGYCFLYYLINLFHLLEQTIIISMNFISILCISKFINKYSENKCLSLLLFLPLYFQFDMQAARTAVAISITVLGVNYIFKRRFFFFCLTIFLAMLFHRSAVVVFPLYFIYNLRVSLLAGLTSIVASVCYVKLIGMDNTVLYILKTLRLNNFYAKYFGYVNNKRFGYPFSLVDPRLLLCILVYVVSKVICKNSNKAEKFFINCGLMNVLIMILFSEHTIFCCRLSAYFNVYCIIIVPLILKTIYTLQCTKNKNGAVRSFREVKLLTVAFYALYGMVYAYVCFISLGLDYKFFF